MLTESEAVSFIESSGKIFAIEFTKRTTGETRMMNCRYGVQSHLRGGPAAYEPKEKNLVIVFDMHKKGYRSIPVENILRVKVDGVWHDVKHERSKS